MLTSTVQQEGQELLASLRDTLSNDGFFVTSRTYPGTPGGEVWAMTSCSHVPIGKYVVMRRGKIWVWYRVPISKPSRDQKLLLGGPSSAVCAWGRSHGVRNTCCDRFGANLPALAEVQ